ncbi:MAG: hypothetical protein WKF47_11210 [Geodermatophilaceae bacterium]
MRTDCHQHLWPEPLLDALRARRTPPRLDGWTLHLTGEAPFVVRPSDVDPVARAERELAEGTGRVLLSFSSPLGVEHLPEAEGAPLLEAWHAGAAALGATLRRVGGGRCRRAGPGGSGAGSRAAQRRRPPATCYRAGPNPPPWTASAGCSRPWNGRTCRC